MVIAPPVALCVIAALTIKSLAAAPSATLKLIVEEESVRILTRPEISELSALAKVFTAVFPHSQRLAVVVEETPLFIRICPPVRFTPPVIFQMC